MAKTLCIAPNPAIDISCAAERVQSLHKTGTANESTLPAPQFSGRLNYSFRPIVRSAANVVIPPEADVCADRNDCLKRAQIAECCGLANVGVPPKNDL
ncbi:hypothetical protein GCM10009077_44540 [Roseibium denhamense]|uniref:Uncharacterized protein n=1 Tax=Roseibium denhamense TaxID=76305 RepID=A0ABY1PMK8_9HYPH|nr:hypothetical protein SAMN06265374_0151 [Roseibium denhamense]